DAKRHMPLLPWFLKFRDQDFNSHSANLIADEHLKSLKLPQEWKTRILLSMMGINDGKNLQP
ncbi:Hypothetical protein FKW44_012298, partial [Caligus rogercresseyi]